MIIEKEILGALSSAIVISAYIFYAHQILTGKIKPHIFSWIIWTTTEGIAFFAQVSGGSGPGAWGSGATAICCSIVILLSLKRGEKNITRGDTISFSLALAAIPLWYLTNNPLYALLLITSMDLEAFYMTSRKSWHKPHEENITLYMLSGARCGVALFAIENISFTTMVYPCALAIADTVLVILLFYRRMVLKKS